jgi:hypothetical protein
LLLDVNTGAVSTVGVGTAYVCTSTHDPEVCKPDTNFTFESEFYAKPPSMRFCCVRFAAIVKFVCE